MYNPQTYETLRNKVVAYHEQKRNEAHTAHLFYMDALYLGHFNRNLPDIRAIEEKAWSQTETALAILHMVNRQEIEELAQ